MAYVSQHSNTVIGGVASENIPEGRAVVIAASGLKDTLPEVSLASADAKNVFVAIIPDDDFPRPTPVQLFDRNHLSQRDIRDSEELGLADPFVSTYIGPSQKYDPVCASGWVVQLHTGGTYAIPSGHFTTVPAQAAQIKVANDGKWAVDATGANAVGHVVEVRDGNVYLRLYR